MSALEGTLVIDISQLLPGSLCSQILADLGAKVIKVEGLGGDGFRHSTVKAGESGSFFQVLNRNKLGMCLDLKKTRGRGVLLDMVPKADVFIESCRPGALDKLGLGYRDLEKINPRLVYCSLTGFGQDGPYRDRVAHDINFSALAGILHLLGDGTGRPPIPSVQIGGAGGGSLMAAVGILAALLGRARTGKGQYLDVAILDGLTPFMALSMSEHLAGAKTAPGETGSTAATLPITSTWQRTGATWPWAASRKARGGSSARPWGARTCSATSPPPWRDRRK